MLLETAEILLFRVSSERSPYNGVFKVSQLLKRQNQPVLCFAGAVLVSHCRHKDQKAGSCQNLGFLKG